jgi:mRNA-degrading endonuclease RelE of RelBE toxin-antitoxin system
MAYKIILTNTFQADFKRLTKKYPSLPADFRSLLYDLQMNPKRGTSLGMNCYKIRMAVSSKNKVKAAGPG